MAARYFNTNHPYYRALECQSDTSADVYNRAQVLSPRPFLERKREIATLSKDSRRALFIGRRSTPRIPVAEGYARMFR